jgi:YidC/Oxa1 family membrane protein insertase
MNQKISEVYQTNKVNPLAGCLPSIVQIPVFIGLYRAVLDMAKADKLNEAFLFLPNLEGPLYSADTSQGSSWLFSDWVNGVPSLGWDDTLAFLILPVFLVISQFVSMELMQPKDQEPQQGNAILKFLPLMIGWFSLSVPSALCLYWVTNNVVTTATTLFIRNSMKMEPVAASSSTDESAPSKSDIFAPPPMREKPAGFKSSAVDSDGVKPITAIDAEVIDEEDGSGAPMESSKVC